MTQLVKVPMADAKQTAPQQGRRRAMPSIEDLRETLPARLRPVWRLIQRIGPLERVVNRVLINQAIERLPPRPYRLSTKLDFTTQDTLTDKTYNCRQLPPTESSELRDSPDLSAVVKLFERDQFIPCDKSTVLFAYVAQWFTDGFLRSDRSAKGDKRDITRNESTHEVDLAQLYGLNEHATKKLRDVRQPMLLAYQGEPGEELPPDLYSGGERVRQFAGLRTIGTSERHRDVDKAQLLAMGSDVSNTQIGYAMLNTLFLREHNRIAREIAEENPGWSDDRIFAAARSVLTALLIKVVIEQYINHIHPFHFEFRFDPRGFDKRPWMRSNWVAVEFNLLYRWHSLIPDELDLGAETLALKDTTFRTKDLLSTHGLASLVDSASRQPAGRIGLRNTPAFLLDWTERPSIQAGRTVRLRGYNEYLEACKFRRARSFEDISSDPQIGARLRDVYGHVDEVELYVGLFAEDVRRNSVLPSLMGRLVGLHAFSQLLTNPLFSPELYNEKTFSRRGMQIVRETRSLAEVVNRNIPNGGRPPLVTLTRTDWKRV